MDTNLITAAIDAGMQLINLAIKAAQDLKQSGELSQADSDALDAKIAGLNKQAWWTPEA